jgi:hypothetical protein
MSRKHSFRAVIKNAGSGGAFVEIPFDVEETFGSKRPKVKAMIEGVPYRGTLVRMGTECHILGVPKEIRTKTGRDVGDTIKVALEEDTEPRVVEVPPDLAKALMKEKAAQAYFNSLSYSHQREYVGYITEARREETRAKRIVRTIEVLKQGKQKKPPG